MPYGYRGDNFFQNYDVKLISHFGLGNHKLNRLGKGPIKEHFFV